MVVVVKRSACSPSTPTIWFRIPLKPAYSFHRLKFVFEKNEKNEKMKKRGRSWPVEGCRERTKERKKKTAIGDCKMMMAMSKLWSGMLKTISFTFHSLSNVTRLGDFWKFWVTNFLAKVVQMYVDFLNSFECIKFSCINWFGYFLGKFRIILGYFIFQHPVALVSTKHPWRRRNNPETTEYLIPPFLMHLLASVWPDWAIFESSLQQFFF